MFAKTLNKLFPSGSKQSWSFHDDRFGLDLKSVVFSYQLGQDDVLAIEPEMFILSRVVVEKSLASKIHKALIKNRIIDEKTHHLNTPLNIDGTALASEIVFITRTKLSLLVNVLFWWEEEMKRWSEAETEKQRFREAMQSAMPATQTSETTKTAEGEAEPDHREMKIQSGLMVIESLQRELPSRREGPAHDQREAHLHEDEQAAGIPSHGENLPTYEK